MKRGKTGKCIGCGNVRPSHDRACPMNFDLSRELAVLAMEEGRRLSRAEMHFGDVQRAQIAAKRRKAQVQ